MPLASVMTSCRGSQVSSLGAHSVGGQYSTYSAVHYGVPQGRVLGPILFLLYTDDVLVIAARHGVGAHSYADDTQLYLHTTAENFQL